MKRIFVFLILLSYNIKAQPNAVLRPVNLDSTLHENIILALNYLEQTQRKSTKAGVYYKGEWQTYMNLNRSFFLLGKKRNVDDSNCFSVAFIHNILAKIYLSSPEYKTIPAMLDLSFERIMAYKTNNKFNFWNLLPPNRKLLKTDIVGQQPMVRRPTNYTLKSKYINNAANVVEDADDTALGYTAMALHQKTNHTSIDSFKLNSMFVTSIFDKYRDLNRKNRHWYNYMFGNDHNTGAYLTWLDDEYEFKHWNIVKVIGHNATFYLPFSECFPHPYKPYLPYGSNDLDGVVNANVLNALSYFDLSNAEGFASTVKYIERKCKQKKFTRVAIYYPNIYQFPYSVANAFSNGIPQLKTSTDYILQFILDNQNKDGSWSSRWVVNKRDKLQSTVYAVNALIKIGNFEENKSKESIEKAIHYILENTINDGNGVHWKGGVFFSGGTVIRNYLFWKSDAYTTSIVIDSFVNYSKYLQQSNKNYTN